MAITTSRPRSMTQTTASATCVGLATNQDSRPMTTPAMNSHMTAALACASTGVSPPLWSVVGGCAGGCGAQLVEHAGRRVERLAACVVDEFLGVEAAELAALGERCGDVAAHLVDPAGGDDAAGERVGALDALPADGAGDVGGVEVAPRRAGGDGVGDGVLDCRGRVLAAAGGA